MKRLGLTLIALVALLLVAAGCQAKESTKLLVPGDANVVASIQVNKLLADVDWDKVYDSVPDTSGEKPPTLKEALDTLFQETGIDVTSFTEATVFARTSEQDYFGAILVGTFDEGKFIQGLEAQKGQKTVKQTFEGHALYLEADQKTAFAFIGKDVLVAGAPQAVKDALSVDAGKKTALSGDLKTAFDDLGAPLVKLVVSVPDSLRQEIQQGASGSGSPIDLSGVAGIQMLAVSVDKEGPDIRLLVKGRYDSADAAQKAQSVLEGARLLLSGMIPLPELSTVLNKILVTRQEAWVSLSLKTTIDEINGVVAGFSKLGVQMPEIPMPTPAR